MSADAIAIPEVVADDKPVRRVLPARVASRRPAESLSPFISWSDEERDGSLEELLETQTPSLLRELLTAPATIASRLTSADSSGLVRVSLVVLVGACAFSGALLAVTLESPVMRTALLVPLSLLVALVAALGPIAAVSIVLGVRVPWARLAGTLVAAMASGALATAAVTPFAVVLHRLDAEWAGPMAVIAAFSVAGVVAGKRTRDLLLLLAASTSGRTSETELGAEERERVAMLARISTMVVGFTTALAIWSFRVLG